MRSGKLLGRKKREAGAVTQETVEPEEGGHIRWSAATLKHALVFISSVQGRHFLEPIFF